MTAYNSLTALKTALDNTIKTNSANEITGNVMNSALDNIVDNVSAQSSLFPNFDLAIPKQTIEFDVASTTPFQILSLANSGLVFSSLHESAAFRVTCTTSTAKHVIDCVAIWEGPFTLDYQLFVNIRLSAATMSSLSAVRPKTINSSAPWLLAITASSADTRHVKIEVFYNTEAVTFVSTLTNASIDASTQDTRTLAINTSYGVRSLLGIPIHVDTANSASFAGMITSYLSTYMGGGNIYTAGVALTANNLIFQGTDGKGYPISTTNVAIRPNVPIALCGANCSANGNLSFGNIREKGITSFEYTSATYGTFAQGDEVYLRCSMTNGAIYSDGVLTNAMSAGYTWIEIGHAQSAATISYNTSGKPYLTLDANGKLTHVNGQEIAIPNVSMAVSTSSTLADNTYHKLSSTVGTKTFTLPTISDTASVHNIIIAFTTSSSPNITFSSSATIMYASDFALEASKTYEVNCLWNGTVWVLTAFAYESAS